MEQIVLTFDPPRARRTDPVTSHDAALGAVRFASKHAAICYGVIVDMGARGATARDIAEYSRLDFVQANRRLHELDGRVITRRLKPNARHGRDFQARQGCAIWWLA